ncbi:MAG TPA: hypothetical protein VGH76_01175 [Actinomycetospora sp.]|uniref:hypothetical protein n=1 Tax=Actinomycetospora sp. TaxID=1872135 RepID=UPI002F3F9986
MVPRARPRFSATTGRVAPVMGDVEGHRYEGEAWMHTEHADGPGIRAGLEQTLANLKAQLDGSSTESAG